MNFEHYLAQLNAALDGSHLAVLRGEWLLNINDYLPYVGAVMVLSVMFVKRFRTEGPIISSILHLYLLVFLMQMWADDGSLMFSPSRQSVMARLLILGIAVLTLVFSCRMKKLHAHTKRKLYACESDNRRLDIINEHLKEQLSNKTSS